MMKNKKFHFSKLCPTKQKETLYIYMIPFQTSTHNLPKQSFTISFSAKTFQLPLPEQPLVCFRKRVTQEQNKKEKEKF